MAIDLLLKAIVLLAMHPVRRAVVIARFVEECELLPSPGEK
jgi:hypothetical protein